MNAKPVLIRGGRLIDPAQKMDAVTDIRIESGKVKTIGTNAKADGAKVIDAAGKVVVPGFIDLHVHFRTPGQEHKESILTGARAAVRGGFTTVCTMANTSPAVDSAPMLEYVIGQAAKVGLLNILPFAAVTQGLEGQTLTDMGKLKEAGAVGFSDDGVPVMSAGVMRRALQYTKSVGLPVIAHCEDTTLSAGGSVHEGITATCCGLRGIPSEAESVMIARDLLLAQATGGRLHIAHVSTRSGVELVRAAKKRGVRVTAEVTPHHLTLTDQAAAGFDPRFKMNPPLRTKQDQSALIEGLKDGTIDAIVTDHAPHTLAEKEVELEHAPFGVVGLETAFAVLYTELVVTGKLELGTLIAALTCRPAAVIGIDRGTLAPGSPADITLLDLDQVWIVRPDQFESKGANTPFVGQELRGQVSDVLVAGSPVFGGKQIINGASS